MVRILLSSQQALLQATGILRNGSTSNLPTNIAIRCRSFAKSKRRRQPGNHNNNNNSNKPFKGRRSHPQQQKKPKKPKNIWKDVVKPNNRMMVPPALLLPTASPYAYVSRAAFNCDDEDPRPLAKSLFEDLGTPLSGSRFEYFAPKSFGHDLPRAKEGQKAIPEVAFLGRSNVGKSSLINAKIAF